jgi:ectoine hydroxylase-related dioxygenase (phytanoyl-CoA dioxygenase family)
LNFKIIGFLNSLKLISLSKKLKLKELSEEILRKPAKLTSIDSYFSPISSNKVFDWHCDQAYSGELQPKKFLNPDHAAIKYFIYLTDVSKNNGCLGYLPQSHKILYFLKLGILNGEIKYKPYWRLNDLRNILNNDDYKNYLEKKIGSESIVKFLEQSDFIINHPHDTYEYDFNLKKGDALIFDESGVHRAAETLKTDRLVLRFIYKNINAPD